MKVQATLPWIHLNENNILKEWSHIPLLSAPFQEEYYTWGKVGWCFFKIHLDKKIDLGKVSVNYYKVYFSSKILPNVKY